MITPRNVIVICLALGLSACVSANPPASRNAAPTQQPLSLSTSTQNAPVQPAGKVVMQAQYDVEEVRISVPRSLQVSEANTFKPRADIVWRGEPRGDRHAQVAKIFEDGMAQGTAMMVKGRAVVIDVEVTRFHALTEKTRYTVGGVHEMRFLLTVRDAASGAVLDGPREVIADVKAAGGAAAIAEDQAGRTQRVVIVERISQVIRRELSAPVTDPLLISRLNTAPATALIVATE